MGQTSSACAYTSGLFIWNLWKEHSASFINFIRKDHERKILFIIWPLKLDFIAFQMDNISRRKCIVETDVVNDVMPTRQNGITRVAIRFLWHDVIHWITATSYDKIIALFEGLKYTFCFFLQFYSRNNMYCQYIPMVQINQMRVCYRRKNTPVYCKYRAPYLIFVVSDADFNSVLNPSSIHTDFKKSVEW